MRKKKSINRDSQQTELDTSDDILWEYAPTAIINLSYRSVNGVPAPGCGVGVLPGETGLGSVGVVSNTTGDVAGI